MKQVIQSYKGGEVHLADVLPPRCGPKQVLVATRASLVSLGTERSIIELGRKSLFGKALARPDLVRRFVEKARTEGIAPTLSQAVHRLDQPVPLGYSSAGIVVATGGNAKRFAVGDRVACVGQGFASHAEVAAVPEMLCTAIPEGVSFESAAFGMVGAIALHGIRCAELDFGETVGVVGLGLVGLLTVQMLEAYGCRVVAADLDTRKTEIASKLGAAATARSLDEFVEAARAESVGNGLDAVLLTLSTDDADAVHAAVAASRFRGRIVLVGVADVHPRRDALWEREVELIVSRAAGAGSLDPAYEIDGRDFSPGLVRWTEGRNVDEVLRLMQRGKLRTDVLVTHRVRIADAEKTYEDILAGQGDPHIGVVFTYPDAPTPKLPPAAKRRPMGRDTVRIGILGPGTFAQSVLLPALRKIEGAVVVAAGGSSGPALSTLAQRMEIPHVTTDYSEIIGDPSVDAVMILTRHASHANLVLEALAAGKHVYVEKPLCINETELAAISEAVAGSDRIVAVGYNRRFSPLFSDLSGHFASRREPLVISYRVNAGYVPPEHWVHQPEEGGSRVVGEMGHFLDAMQALTGALIGRVWGERISGNGRTAISEDNIAVTVRLTDGSVGTLTYTAVGDRGLGRERVEVFGGHKSGVLDDFRRLTLLARGKTRRRRLTSQDLGYAAELRAFVRATRDEMALPLTYAEIANSTAATFALAHSMATGAPVLVDT